MTSIHSSKGISQTIGFTHTQWNRVLAALRGRGNPSIAIFRVYFFAAIFCFVGVELWRVAMLVGRSIYFTYNVKIDPLTVILAVVVVGLLGCLHLIERGAYSSARRLLRSNRVDIALVGVAGGVGGFFWNMFAPKEYEAFLRTIPPSLALYVVALVILIGFAASIRAKVVSSRAKFKGRSALIDDRAITKEVEDGLGIGEMATRFALNVLNERSSASLLNSVEI